MQYIPFKPSTLAFTIAAILLGSQLPLQAQANEASAPDKGRFCTPVTNGGWRCAEQLKQPSVIKRSPLPTSVSATASTAAIATRQSILPHQEGGSLTKTEVTTVANAPIVSSALMATKQTSYSIPKEMNWVPITQLTPLQRAHQPYYSCGAYIEPNRPGKDFRGDPSTQPIIAEADYSSYNNHKTVATLTGNVNVQQASRQLKSDKVILNRQDDSAFFEGNTRIREPGILLIGERGHAQLSAGIVHIEGATYVMYDGNHRGTADTVDSKANKTIVLTNATYTSCPPGKDGWLLSSKNVKLNPAIGFGTARDATIKIEGVPVFYTPYLYFPIDNRRQSGFLYPSIGSNNENGLEMSLPYYFNLAPNYDATITPHILSKRGLLLEAETRYLTKKSQGQFGIAGLIGKDKLEDSNLYYDKNRWLINWRHRTQLTPNWSVNIDYANASDKNYLDDLTSNFEISNSTTLNQQAYTTYSGGDVNHDWQFTLNAQKHKNMSQTANDPYNKLPQLDFKGNWFADKHLQVGYTADYTQFSRDENWHYLKQVPDDRFNPSDEVNRSVYDNGYGIQRAEGGRIYLESGVSSPMMTSYGFLIPELKVRHTQYQLSNLDKEQVIQDLETAYSTFNSSDYSVSPQTTVPSFSLDSGLYFDRQITFGATTFTNTFEPRMKYLYAPYVAGQEMNPIFDTAQMNFSYSSLWRDDRFVGYDRLPDANQLSVGFTTRLLEKNGFERLRFGIGQILYFQDRKVYISPLAGTRNAQPDIDPNSANQRLLDQMKEPTSPLASELVYNINQSMSLSQDFAWDTNTNQADNYGFFYHYRPEQHKTFNIGYRYRDQVDRYKKNKDGNNLNQIVSNNLSQTDLSFAWPIMKHWSALGRWQYDLTNNRNLELLSGIEYSSCCYQVRLLWRSWARIDDNIDYPDNKSGIFLQFVLRGLGSVSSGSATEYLGGIQGYNTKHEKL